MFYELINFVLAQSRSFKEAKISVRSNENGMPLTKINLDLPQMVRDDVFDALTLKHTYI